MKNFINKFNTFYEIFNVNQTLDSKLNLLKCIYYNLKPPKWRSSKVNFYPISTTFYVNTICNYRCSFCFLINEDHKGSKTFNLDLEGFYKLLNHKHIKYSGRVTLGGGEPYLNKYIYDFIKELKIRKKITSIYTNGSLIERQYDKMLENQTDYLNISHYDDKFDDLSHMFKRINEDKNKKFISRLSKLVTSKNYHELDGIIQKAIFNSFDRVILQNYFPYKEGGVKKQHVAKLPLESIVELIVMLLQEKMSSSLFNKLGGIIKIFFLYFSVSFTIYFLKSTLSSYIVLSRSSSL